MLILTRRVGETIIIRIASGRTNPGRCLGVKANQVRIGTDAPDDIAIIREDLLEPEPA